MPDRKLLQHPIAETVTACGGVRADGAMLAPDYMIAPLRLSAQIQAEMKAKNSPPKADGGEKLARVAGGLAFHCSVNLTDRKITEAAAMSTMYRGYEALLPGKDLNKVGLVSATAAGICGGVHATASALCLEMALGLQPPPLGIQVRNLLLSCQYLNDNTMHLFVLAGPDYSAREFQKSNPEIWQLATHSPAKFVATHQFATIAEIMLALNKPDGALYKKALEMVKVARKAYATLGGKYPHSESIIPGGVSIQPSLVSLTAYADQLSVFYDFSKQTIAIWDDIFDFLLAANPAYAEVGKLPANLLDFGQWDHHQAYNAKYADAPHWGEQRWSTPGAVINGKLMTTNLHELNCGIEEFVDHSYYKAWQDHMHTTDPAGNPISLHHPWNKRVHPSMNSDELVQPYSWGSCMTWRRQGFEVGAYARIYISALAKKLPSSAYVQSTGHSLIIHLPAHTLPQQTVEWKIPSIWNAFERNRARAYALAFNQMVTVSNVHIAIDLLKRGATSTASPLTEIPKEDCFGVGLWGAGRGFLAHWIYLKKGVIDNYQIAIPSRINAGPRTPWGALGALEQAVVNTPILETGFKDAANFSAIDIQRCLQSFDPCMPTTASILLRHTDGDIRIVEKEIDTSFPI